MVVQRDGGRVLRARVRGVLCCARVAVAHARTHTTQTAAHTHTSIQQRFEELVAKQLEALKASGMSQAQARQTLKTWAEMGAKTQDELRQLLVQRSMKPVSTLAAQLALDFACSAGAFLVGGGLGGASFTGAIAVQILFYFGGARFALLACFVSC
jgi:hypothetical protein